MVLYRVVDFAQLLVSRCLLPGEQAVDATAGNGSDTVFLAGLVGSSGRVVAFDVQRQALEITSSKLHSHGLQEIVILVEDGHENMEKYISGQVGAVMLNLGYLPGGDHQVITLPDSTLEAVYKALSLLKIGGLLTIVCYPGHAGGDEERNILRKELAEVDQKLFQVMHYSFINRASPPPELIAIEKLG